MNYYNHRRNILQPGYTATVSIVTCTYNRAPYLDRCINSVLQQSIEDWELIIVDDGSRDHTYEVVDKYLVQHKNIRYIKHANTGQGLARNTGILLATGEYITFLDSDDVYAPEHLQTRIDFMRTNPEIDMIHGGVFFNCDKYVGD